MKSYFIYIITILTCIIIPSTRLSAQELIDVKHKAASPERSAEGQTKWMISQLKLDPYIYKTLYSINLKYRLKSDSVHSLSIALTSKKESYLLYDQIRNEELKKVLSADQFEKYQKIVESIKAHAKLVKQ